MNKKNTTLFMSKIIDKVNPTKLEHLLTIQIKSIIMYKNNI